MAPGVSLTVLGAGAASTIIQAGPTPGQWHRQRLLRLSPGGVDRQGRDDPTWQRPRRGPDRKRQWSPRWQADARPGRVSDNTGTHEGGAILSDGLLRITNSAIINNSAPNGAAIYQNTLNPAVGAVELTNVTISGNVDTGSQAQNGIIHYTDSSAPFLLRNVTIVNNQGFALSGGPITVSSSIIAGTARDATHVIFNPQNFSAGHNVTDTGEGCEHFPQPGDIVNVDPKLGPLRTTAAGSPASPCPGSPAIDAGNRPRPAAGQRLPDDRPARRGPAPGRRRRRHRPCDIGAVELPRFQVDSADDAVDAKIGNLECEAADDACTLRAAIQESNALGGALIGVPAGDLRAEPAGVGEDAAATGDLDITQGVTLASKGGDRRRRRARTGSSTSATARGPSLSGLAVQGGAPGSGQAGRRIRSAGRAPAWRYRRASCAGTRRPPGGGIANGARLDLENVTLERNRAADRGGGLLTVDDPAGESVLLN